MEVPSAIALLSQVILKPGWSLECTDHRNRFEGAIVVKIHYPARNTNREEASENPDDNYPNEINTWAAFPIMVSEFEGDDAEIKLHRTVLQAILTIEAHEWRESYRVAPTEWAPFHPHRKDGMKRWGDEQTDLMFGIA